MRAHGRNRGLSGKQKIGPNGLFFASTQGNREWNRIAQFGRQRHNQAVEPAVVVYLHFAHTTPEAAAGVGPRDGKPTRIVQYFYIVSNTRSTPSYPLPNPTTPPFPIKPQSPEAFKSPPFFPDLVYYFSVPFIRNSETWYHNHHRGLLDPRQAHM